VVSQTPSRDAIGQARAGTASAQNQAMMSPVIALPPPLALARLTYTLSPTGVREPRFEAKWDGYRAVVAAGRIWSRRGTDLTRFFPDLAPVFAARLPADTVLDGEVVAWDVSAGRLDFASLQTRMTAGRRLSAVAARRPAHLVCFDLLATADRDIRSHPLAERRTLLAELLSGVGAPIALCQQTEDREIAEDWLQTLAAGGIEGVVIKDATQPYPTRAGQRVWHKVKSRQSLDMLAIGVVGDPSAPTSLVLAMPTFEDEPRPAGATTVLSRAVARAIAPLLELTGQTWQRHSVWGTTEQVEVQQIKPLVVEVSADAAVAGGTLRHAARLVRARPDLLAGDVVDE
jgi:ATP-dependent DNA ligase